MSDKTIVQMKLARRCDIGASAALAAGWIYN